MPLKFTSSDSKDIPANALFVAAGTVTEKSVDTMGAGFNKFKSVFRGEKSTEGDMSWEKKMQAALDNHIGPGTMPAYMQMAQKGTLSGGVATVPYVGEGNTPTAAQEKDYKAAIRGALEDAIKLGKPISMQPLGIGVYGWDPKLAAKLTADVIKEKQAYKDLDVSIPMHFDPSDTATAKQQNQRNQDFQTALAQALSMPAPMPLKAPKKASATHDEPSPHTTVKPTGKDPDQDIDNIIKAYTQMAGEQGVNKKGSPYTYKKDKTKKQVSLSFKSEAEQDAFLTTLAESGMSFTVKDEKGNILGVAKDGEYIKHVAQQAQTEQTRPAPPPPEPATKKRLAIKPADGEDISAEIAKTIGEMQTDPKPKLPSEPTDGNYNMAFDNDAQRDEFLQRLCQQCDFTAQEGDKTFGHAVGGGFQVGEPPKPGEESIPTHT